VVKLAQEAQKALKERMVIAEHKVPKASVDYAAKTAQLVIAELKENKALKAQLA
jgi:hypothetical protein